MADLQQQSERIKMALTLWVGSGKTLATIGQRVVDDERKAQLVELLATIKQATEQIEKL